MLYKDDQLINALKTKNTYEVKRLLIDGASANSKDENGFPALLLAVAGEYTDIVQLLLKHGANPETKASNGDSALFFAVHTGKKDLVKSLIDARVDVNYANNKGVTALHKAALKGDFDIVQLLLENGARVDAQQSSGTTALIIAASQGHASVVKALLVAGADPHFKYNNLTALDFAESEGHYQIVSMLKEKTGKGGCFIATAVYGSELSPEVLVLRRFRDEILRRSAIGRLFESCYYFISPRIAKMIISLRIDEFLKKFILNPLVKIVYKNFFNKLND